MKIFITALLLISSSTFASPMSDSTYLHKLSLSLRGVPPIPADYVSLAKARDKNAFFDQTIQTYLTSTAHQDRFVYQMSEFLQLAPAGGTDTLLQRPELKDRYSYQMPVKHDALVELLKTMTLQNLSWDQLLTAKSYLLYPGSSFSNAISDFEFLGFLNDKIPMQDSSAITAGDSTHKPVSDGKTPFPITFAPDDVRIAGVLTTGRFDGRYNTTGINKNRRRAAAVFRTFLCDPMIPSIGSDGDRTHDFNNVAFAENYVVTEAMIQQSISPNARHGSDQACASCHYKLDPMGRTFQAMGLALSTEPSPGALVFKNKAGQLVDIPVRGLGELGKAVVAQPEFADCQVGWFWQQYIGKDVRLTSQRRADLVAAFEKVGRRTNDFTKFIVTLPEFREKLQTTSQYVTFDQVQPLLKKCDACHAKIDDMPVFSKLPITLKGDAKEHVTWIADMTERLGRAEGVKGRMPKDALSWDPSEIQLIKSWLSQGARDEQGQPTVPTPGARP